MVCEYRPRSPCVGSKINNDSSSSNLICHRKVPLEPNLLIWAILSLCLCLLWLLKICFSSESLSSYHGDEKQSTCNHIDLMFVSSNTKSTSCSTVVFPHSYSSQDSQLNPCLCVLENIMSLILSIAINYNTLERRAHSQGSKCSMNLIFGLLVIVVLLFRISFFYLLLSLTFPVFCLSAVCSLPAYLQSGYLPACVYTPHLYMLSFLLFYCICL